MWRRIALAVTGGAALWLVAVWPPPRWWQTHTPRRTAMMRWAERRYGSGAAADVRPVALAEVSPLLPRMVILAEDARFRSHPGIDVLEIREVLGLRRGADMSETLRILWQRRDRLRGASTITQQLAKNLYLSPARNPLRKLKEIAVAFRLEGALSKDRILELYLNVAEFGPGVWGADAASRAYYGVAARSLSVQQAASLAATLPHPRTSNPAFRPGRMLARRDLILARYHGADVVIPPLDDLDLDIPLDSLPVIPVLRPVIPPLESLRIDLPLPVDTPPADSGGSEASGIRETRRLRPVSRRDAEA